LIYTDLHTFALEAALLNQTFCLANGSSILFVRNNQNKIRLIHYILSGVVPCYNLYAKLRKQQEKVTIHKNIRLLGTGRSGNSRLTNAYGVLSWNDENVLDIERERWWFHSILNALNATEFIHIKVFILAGC
jgi:hypothetical protein